MAAILVYAPAQPDLPYSLLHRNKVAAVAEVRAIPQPSSRIGRHWPEAITRNSRGIYVSCTYSVVDLKWLLSCILLSLATSSAAWAQESLFVAQVERIILEPRGGKYCMDPCAANGRRNPDGSTYVCFSNDGGCESTEFVVERVLFGDVQPGAQTRHTRIGEWGGTQLPVTHAPILVHIKPGLVEWAPLKVKDGNYVAQVKAFRQGGIVNGVDLPALARGNEGTVALDVLVEIFSNPPAKLLIR